MFNVTSFSLLKLQGHLQVDRDLQVAPGVLLVPSVSKEIWRY